ncbi:MAG: RHS repeat-associated core domain-containing protein [Clostridiales bacterium]|nr:RHS repeat-associated core domain-containing protein [Clostridiales bacterium]
MKVYDNNGNIVLSLTERYKDLTPDTTEEEVTNEGNDFFESYKYNNKNQLVEVNKNNKTVHFSYDLLGKRVSKTVDGNIKKHVWNGSNIVLELDNTNAVLNYYQYGSTLIYREKSDSSKVFYFQDAHGDTKTLTDLLGVVTKRYVYDSYGEEVNPDENDDNPFRYFSQYYDKEVGFYYLRVRYYDPSTMRFTQEDTYLGTANDPLSLNRYLYVSCNPILFIDPSGHQQVIDDQGNQLVLSEAGPTAEEAAILAAHVYGRGNVDLPEGWSQIDSFAEGGLLMSVYYNSKKDLYVIANAGTEPTMGFKPFGIDMIQNGKATFGVSQDVNNSVKFSEDFVADNKDAHITFVGHSKGGGEAIKNAVATNRNAIIFNPRREWDIPSTYSGTITSYVVKGEILNSKFGQTFGVDVIYMDTQHEAGFFGYYFGYIGDIARTKAMLDNHGMPSVISALKSRRNE